MARTIYYLTIVIFLLCGSSLFLQQAKGLDPNRALTQYLQVYYGIDEGLPANSVQFITQSSDGYIWLATQEGAVRFDGVKFEYFDKKTTEAIKNNYILFIYESKDKAIWIGSNGGGLVRLYKNTVTNYMQDDGLVNDFVNGATEDNEGNLYFATQEGISIFKNGSFVGSITKKEGLAGDFVNYILYNEKFGLLIGFNGNGFQIYKDGRFVKLYNTQNGLKDNIINKILVDEYDNIWLATNGGLSVISNNIVKNYGPEQGLTTAVISYVMKDSRGTMWIASNGGGLFRFRNGKFDNINKANGFFHDVLLHLCEDREGNLWVGSNGGGMVQLKNSKFLPFSMREGLSSNFVWSIVEDKNGDLWVSTNDAGVNWIKNNKVIKVFNKDNGLRTNNVRPLLCDRNNVIWVGTGGEGIFWIKDGQIIKNITTKDGLSNNFLRVIYEDSKGNVWIGGNGGGLTLYKDGKMQIFTVSDGLAGDFPRVVKEDSKGNIWIGTNSGISKYSNGKFKNYTTKSGEGLSNNLIRYIYEDKDGVFWFGTESGLNRFENEKFFSYTTKDGMADNLFFSVIEDDEGFFWMTCNRGIMRVSKKELNDYAKGKISKLNVKLFGKADGMINPECNGGAQPTGFKGRDKKIYFPTMGGVVIIDPKNLSKNEIKPNVIIEKLIVDGKEYNVYDDKITIPAGASNFEIHYTATSFYFPKAVKFKYMLEGYEKEWMDAGNRRVAYYTNIWPGEYTFRVIACNNDEVWNEEGANLSFYFTPYFYQTIWFAIFLLGVLGGGIYSGIRYRVKKMEENEKKLNQKIEEMTSDLKEANYKIMLEKQSVEKRIEEAVAQIEKDKNYLKESVDLILAKMDKFAAGDLTVSLEVLSEDEIGMLFAGFNQSVENIRNMIKEIQLLTDTMASSSAQISASVEELAAGSDMQVSHIEELKTSIDEINHSIEDTAKNIVIVSEKAKKAGEIASSGGSIVQESINKMNQINKTALEAADLLKELTKSSQQIGAIVNVINDIADQTNLLALNAAIEAARAGEHGRGFAVVADEVRKLSENTTKATKEIAQMIKKIQTETEKAYKTMLISAEEINSGKELSAKSGESLNEIIKATEEVANLILQIAAAAEQQSANSATITHNAERINQIVKESTQGIMQIAKAADGLTQLSTQLQKLIQRFKA